MNNKNEEQNIWSRLYQDEGYALYMQFEQDSSGGNFLFIHIKPDLTFDGYPVSGRIKGALNSVKVSKMFDDLYKSMDIKTNKNLEFPYFAPVQHKYGRENPIQKNEKLLSFNKDVKTCGDEISKTAIEELQKYIDVNLHDACIVKGYLGKYCYDTLIQNPEFKKEMDDIYARHPWAKIVLEEYHIFATIQATYKSNWGSFFKRHPDETMVSLVKMVGMTGVPKKYTAIKAMAGMPADARLRNDENLYRFIEVFSHVPLDWAKKWIQEENISDLLDFTHVRNLVTNITEDDIYNLFKSSKGNFKACLKTLEKRNKFADKVYEINDFLRNFQSDILSPLMSVAYEEGNEVLTPGKRRSLAWKIGRDILGFEGIKKLKELSNKWHIINQEITNHLEYGKGVKTWPALCENYVASNGIIIMPLINNKQLIDEGGHGKDENGVNGLNHCVGSYNIECQKGTTHIISMRKRNGKNLERLSTAEYFYNVSNHEISLKQHRGMSNSIPRKDAQAALEEWQNLVKANVIKLNTEEIVENIKSFKKTIPKNIPIEILQRGLDAWRPLLKGEYKRMDAEDLVLKVFDYDEKNAEEVYFPNRGRVY